MSNPLLNPVVLDLVFARLSIPELKQVRFVCREWSDVSATVLGKRTFLKANKLFRYDGTNLSRPAAVAENLIRRLRIHSDSSHFHPSIPTKMRELKLSPRSCPRLLNNSRKNCRFASTGRSI
ncbi:uncharacterized protein LOC118438271 [Folsomia candida]|uniref:uncharacterized protein LOC118438271 n=1 Tax=Folsomia candida TaxID=158441 RepID=UPI0016054655|nr:uncharacterized protein LOC118438271 [Folsomia candida]